MQCKSCGTSESAAFSLLFVGARDDANARTFMCHCGFCFTEPGADARRPDGTLYSSGGFSIQARGSELPTDEKIAAVEKLAANRFKLLNSIWGGKNPGRVLEVGCGMGPFLGMLAKRGWIAEGIEPDPGYARFGQSRYQVPIQAKLFEQFEGAPGSFDVVASFHVLEHVASPHGFLSRACTLLKPGGLLLIEVPTLDHPNWKSWRAFFWTLHPNVLTADHLKHMVEANGFVATRIGLLGKFLFGLAVKSDTLNAPRVIDDQANRAKKTELYVSEFRRTALGDGGFARWKELGRQRILSCTNTPQAARARSKPLERRRTRPLSNRQLPSGAKLHIHIGTHKTGSTAIQQALRHSRKQLKEEGIAYLRCPRSAIALMRCTSLEPRLISKVRNAFGNLCSRNSLRSEKDPRFVMSWEGFSGSLSEGYENAGVVAKSLREITSGLDVHIIVYLRPQDEFLESLYTQMIHLGASYSFQEFLAQVRPPRSFNWENLLASYAESFGKANVVARRYHRRYLPSAASILDDFASILGRNLILRPGAQTQPNAGFSRHALEAARIANRYLQAEERARLRRILQRTSAKQPFERYTFFTESERQSLLRQYEESNARVAVEYLEQQDGVLFPAGNSDRIPDAADHGRNTDGAVLTLAKAIIFIDSKNRGRRSRPHSKKLRAKFAARGRPKA